LQYLLIGLALSMFYVLLLALAEQIRFARACVISAVAVVILMRVYIADDLGSCRRCLASSGQLSGALSSSRIDGLWRGSVPGI
jgi:inner membrane protein